MIDLHSHILYGVDDGPKDLAASLDMLSAALDVGFTHVAATPHYIHGTEFASRAEENRDILQTIKEQVKLPHLYLGSELFYDHEGTDHLAHKRAIGINGSRYVMVEVPRENMHFSSLLNYVFQLEIQGYSMILAHAERYDFIHKDPNYLASLIKRDVYIQLNLCSLVGRYGKTVEKTAKTMLEHNMVHLVATDAHNSEDYRRCNKARTILEDLVGEETMNTLIVENPGHILRDQIFYPDPPTKVKQRSLFSWMKK